jgi:hypothetical protein
MHLKDRYPELRYRGGDLFPEIVDHCRRNPKLAGVEFEVLDVRDLKSVEPADVVIVNAVLFRFLDDEFLLSLQNLFSVIKPGGQIFGFEFIHAFEQRLIISETSVEHPEGLTLVFRPKSEFSKVVVEAGFEQPWFQPFEISIDLPKPTDPRSIITFTTKTDAGARLNFRGSLYLPWCHWGAKRQSK